MTRRPSRRTVVGGLLVALVIALELNVLGVLRYPGGPLREPSADALLWLDIRPADQGAVVAGDAPGYWHQAGVPLQYGMLTLANPSSLSGTIEAVTPVDPTPGLVVDAVYLMKPGSTRGEVLAWGPGGVYPPQSTIDQDYTTLPAQIGPTDEAHLLDPGVILVVRSLEPGPIGWSALAIDYRIGPFTFRVIQHAGLTGCIGPLPTGSQCGADPEGTEEEDEEGEEEGS